MPLAKFKCGNCSEILSVVTGPKSLTIRVCLKCGLVMAKVASAPTSNIVETLDNGLMSKRVERPADAERLYKERAVADNDRIYNPKL